MKLVASIAATITSLVIPLVLASESPIELVISTTDESISVVLHNNSSVPIFLDPRHPPAPAHVQQWNDEEKQWNDLVKARPCLSVNERLIRVEPGATFSQQLSFEGMHAEHEACIEYQAAVLRRHKLNGTPPPEITPCPHPTALPSDRFRVRMRYSVQPWPVWATPTSLQTVFSAEFHR